MFIDETGFRLVQFHSLGFLFLRLLLGGRLFIDRLDTHESQFALLLFDTLAQCHGAYLDSILLYL